MMRITQFNQPRMAQAFVDYMATQGITLRIEHENHYVIMLDDESKIAVVENELQQFLHDPNHPRYQAASWHSGKTDSGLRYERSKAARLTAVCAMSAAISGRTSASVPVR